MCCMLHQDAHGQARDEEHRRNPHKKPSYMIMHHTYFWEEVY